MDAHPAAGVEAEVLRIRSMMRAQRHADALLAAQALLATVPDNRDVGYMAAVCLRQLGRVGDALGALGKLEAAHPAYSRLYQERGHCHVAQGDPAAALASYLHAVSLNAALPASWQALSILFGSAGRVEEARNAASHVSKLRSLPAAVVTASSMFADGEVHEAERVVRDHLQTSPRDVEAMRLLARIGMKLDVLDDAEFLLESVLEFSPDYHLARYDYVRVLLHRHRNLRALEECRILLRAQPGNRDYRAAYASACLALGDHGEAIRTYRALADAAPEAAELHLSIGHAHKTLGRQQEAIGSYRTAAGIRPGFGDAYWSLANLKTYRFSEQDIASMRALEARATESADRIHFRFALGKALEDAGEFAQSFAWYARGNALKRAEIAYRPEVIERGARLQASLVTRDLVRARGAVGCELADPIFIVGLPRAGSTLIEQILASHPQVDGTMELADIARMVQTLQGRRHDENAPVYPGILRDLSAERLRRMGEKYLADTQVYRTGRAFFIDKNPNNFRHLGLIHLILPNARIIDARREPMACCFGNYKQLFASGQEFTYDLEDIGRYYRSYVALMAHWQGVMPGRILRVQHEALVGDLEAGVRRILEFCGLPFEPRCLRFHETERSVRTASSEQVRRPIYTEGLTHWRHYEPWLDTLKHSLGGLVPA